MIEVKQERRGDGTSLFIEFEDGKKKTAFVAPSMTDAELEKKVNARNGVTKKKKK
jgi:hypothetical protein